MNTIRDGGTHLLRCIGYAGMIAVLASAMAVTILLFPFAMVYVVAAQFLEGRL